MIITARQVRRSGRGVAGTSRAVGAMYGWSWGLGCAAAYGVNVGLAAQGLPARLLAVARPGTTLLVTGLLYLAGGLLWQDRVHYGLGAWILSVAVGSVFAGAPGNLALIALAGGGGLLTGAGLAYQSRYARAPR